MERRTGVHEAKPRLSELEIHGTEGSGGNIAEAMVTAILMSNRTTGGTVIDDTLGLELGLNRVQPAAVRKMGK